MRNTWRLVLSAALLPSLSLSPASAQEALNPAISKLDDEVTAFLQVIAGNEPRRAFSQLLSGSQLNTRTEAVEQMVRQIEQLERTYGAFRESERISRKQVGKDLVLLKYLYKCKYFPVVWYFTYYREPSSRSQMGDANPWVVISVKFDTQFEALADGEK